MLKEYRQTSSYGWRTHPITGKKTFHAGVDLVKGYLEIIYPFKKGTVIFAGEGKKGTGLGGYGNVVLIVDDNERVHLYAHLQIIYTQVGKYVTTKDKIGAEGKTGNVTGSHLHYEIRKSDSPSFGWTSNPESSTLDPIKYIEGNEGRMVEKLKVDGKVGMKTVKRLQQFLGVKQDGLIGKDTAKKLQTFLNTYGQ